MCRSETEPRNGRVGVPGLSRVHSLSYPPPGAQVRPLHHATSKLLLLLAPKAILELSLYLHLGRRRRREPFFFALPSPFSTGLVALSFSQVSEHSGVSSGSQPIRGGRGKRLFIFLRGENLSSRSPANERASERAAVDVVADMRYDLKPVSFLLSPSSNRLLVSTFLAPPSSFFLLSSSCLLCFAASLTRAHLYAAISTSSLKEKRGGGRGLARGSTGFLGGVALSLAPKVDYMTGPRTARRRPRRSA